MSDYLTVPDVAQLLQVSRAKVYVLKDRIGWSKIGGAIRFRRRDIDRLFEDGFRRADNRRRPTIKPTALKHLVQR